MSVKRISCLIALTMVAALANSQVLRGDPGDATSKKTVPSSCANGFLGVFDGGADYAPAPGQAVGWINRYEHIMGDSTYYTYESVVRLAPSAEDVGRYGAIALVAANDDGATVIDGDGNPSYVTYYRSLTGMTGTLDKPVFKGALQSMHEWRKNFGTQPPQMDGVIYVGYGLISQEAQEKTIRLSNATKTMLPTIENNLKRELENARLYPDSARRALASSCGSALPSSPGHVAGDYDATLDAMLRNTCSSMSQSADLRQICDNMRSNNKRASDRAKETADRVRQAQAKIAEAGGGGGGGRILDEEMKGICERGDIEAYYARKLRDARLQAQDLEAISKAGAWELGAAMKDSSARGLCWSVLQWTTKTESN